MHKRKERSTDVGPDTRVLVSVDDAAAMLSLGRSLVYDLVIRKQLVSIKVGRMRRIPVTSLYEFVARQLSDLEVGA